MKNYDEKIIAGIKRAMKSCKVSMRSLSERTEIPYRSIQNYLSGRSRMPADVYLHICEALGIDNQYVLHNDFYLQHLPLFDALWAALGESLATANYKPYDYGAAFDDMEKHNLMQRNASDLATNISKTYNKELLYNMKESYGTGRRHISKGLREKEDE